MTQTVSNFFGWFGKDDGSNKMAAGAAVATAGTGAVIVYQNNQFHQDKMKQNQALVDAKAEKHSAEAKYYDSLSRAVERDISLGKYEAAKDVKPLYSDPAPNSKPKLRSNENLRGGGESKTNEIYENNEMDTAAFREDQVSVSSSGVPSTPIYSYESRNLYAGYSGVFLAGAFGFMAVTVLFHKGMEKFFPNKLNSQAKKNMEIEIENSNQSLQTQKQILETLKNLEKSNVEIKTFLENFSKKN